ncbi:MAG: DUF2020 domain-containing protein [Corynebacterium sp.]|nr:DUF2020 domain-containing protein [Corynebacterium sp.]
MGLSFTNSDTNATEEFGARRLKGTAGLLMAGLASTFLLTACSQDNGAESATEQSAATETNVSIDSSLPIDAMPNIAKASVTSNTDCPYLETQWVADTNGQRMTAWTIDTQFETPACVFWSYQDDPQATVIVRHMNTVEDARAVVDWAAPIDYTDPASEPAGWEGGRYGGDGRSLYAVAKDNVAVVVFSNQEQSVKPAAIAKQVIANLGL